jgi:hypothetical protein
MFAADGPGGNDEVVVGCEESVVVCEGCEVKALASLQIAQRSTIVDFFKLKAVLSP